MLRATCAYFSRLTQGITVHELDKNNLEARLDLDLLPVAGYIERTFKDWLLPAPTGIYRFDRVDPVLDMNKVYFTRNEFGLNPITDINAVHQGVYDQNGKLVIPGMMMKKKDTMLSTTAVLPYRGVLIAAAVIESTIDSFIQWRAHGADVYSKVARHFNQEIAQSNEFTEIIDNATAELCQQLYEWFDGKSWNIFLATRHNTRMRIERYGDYRIVDWMDRYEKGEIKL